MYSFCFISVLKNFYLGHFPNETSPEILRSGLVNEILSMFALGITNPLKFDLLMHQIHLQWQDIEHYMY